MFRVSSQAVGILLALISGVALLRPALAMSGSVDLYLQNASLDSNSARSINNIAYYGVYYIGTPPRKFLGCIDTGSGDTWVPSSTCTSQVCKSHDQYDAGLSSTERNSTRFPATVQYGTGTVSVILTYDTMSLANVTITDQGFGVATSLSYDFSSISCDGLVGMGFQTLSSTGAVPPFMNAVREGALDNNLFAIWMSPNPGYEPAGQMTMGNTDSSKFSGQITYIDVTRNSYWQVAMGRVTVGSSDAGISTRSAILDSGTTAIVMSTSDSNRINQLIPGAVYWDDMLSWNVSCDINSLPAVTFYLGGQGFAVPPSLYVQLLTDSNGVSLGICTSAIVGGGGSSSSGSLAVLGTNFLRAWYTIYSFDQSSSQAQVGLAKSAGQSGVNAGGRRLKQGEDQPIFSRPVHTLRQPKQWGNEAPGNRRLSEVEQPQEQPEQPSLFHRTASSVGKTKWSN